MIMLRSPCTLLGSGRLMARSSLQRRMNALPCTGKIDSEGNQRRQGKRVRSLVHARAPGKAPSRSSRQAQSCRQSSWSCGDTDRVFRAEQSPCATMLGLPTPKDARDVLAMPWHCVSLSGAAQHAVRASSAHQGRQPNASSHSPPAAPSLSSRRLRQDVAIFAAD